MIKNLTGAFVLTLAVTITGGVALPTTANANESYCTESMKCLNHSKDYSELTQTIKKGDGKEFATRVRIAFLKAKKAFHEARQEIQAIKKGDESPREDAPCFFCDEEDSDEEFQEEGPELQG